MIAATERANPRRVVAALLGSAILVGAAYAGYAPLQDGSSYPVFHIVIELAGITIAAAIFMLVWTTRRTITNGFFTVVGVSAIWVGAIALLHALTYKGMGLVDTGGSNIPTQLWLAERFLLAGALLAAPLFVNRRVNPYLALVVSGSAAIGLCVAIYPLGVFPDAFIEGAGLTRFKVVSEYAICATLALGLVLLLRRRDDLGIETLAYLAASLALIISSELAFTLYIDPFGPANYIGHLLQVFSFMLLFRALVTSAVTHPLETLYRGTVEREEALRASEARFRATFEQATLGIMHIDPEGRILRANARMAEIAGRDRKSLTSLYAEELTDPADRVTELELSEALAEGTLGDYRLEKRILTPDSARTWVNTSRSAVHGADGELLYFAEMVEDISVRKEAEEHLHRQRDLNATITSIDHAINSTFDIDEIIRRAVAEAAMALRADSAAVLMREGEFWVARHTWHFPEDIIGEHFSDEDVPHAAEAAITGVPVVIEDTRVDGRVDSALTARFDARSVIAIPLAFRGRQMGMLYFDYHGEPRTFDKDDIDFVVKLSSGLALAIQNARLYEAERRTVDAIQAALLHVAEDTPGISVSTAYHSATELTRIGGDFYDVFLLPDGRIAFSIGDVAGKGVEAASITATAKSTLRAFSYEWSDPARVMDTANKALTKQLDESRFITAVYGVFEPATGDLSIVCAGHPAPLVCAGTQCTDEWVVRNPPLGVFDDTRFEPSHIALRSGEQVVLFTDGLLDARGTAGFLGETKLREMVAALDGAPPATVASSLLEAAHDHAGGFPADDIAILVFRYEGAPVG